MKPETSPVLRSAEFHSAVARARLVIAGVGNVLLRDDGVGVHAVQSLLRDPIPGVSCFDVGTAILHGLSWIEGAERVLILDAVKGGQPPGAIYLFDAEARVEEQALTSLHALGLREAARLLLPGRPLPSFTVLGVEPESLDYGLELSRPVQAALPHLVALARETAEDWRRATVDAANRRAA
jgi:hydrogenase maturation protease